MSHIEESDLSSISSQKFTQEGIFPKINMTTAKFYTYEDTLGDSTIQKVLAPDDSSNATPLQSYFQELPHSIREDKLVKYQEENKILEEKLKELTFKYMKAIEVSEFKESNITQLAIKDAQIVNTTEKITLIEKEIESIKRLLELKEDESLQARIEDLLEKEEENKLLKQQQQQIQLSLRESERIIEELNVELANIKVFNKVHMKQNYAVEDVKAKRLIQLSSEVMTRLHIKDKNLITIPSNIEELIKCFEVLKDELNDNKEDTLNKCCIVTLEAINFNNRKELISHNWIKEREQLTMHYEDVLAKFSNKHKALMLMNSTGQQTTMESEEVRYQYGVIEQTLFFGELGKGLNNQSEEEKYKAIILNLQSEIKEYKEKYINNEANYKKMLSDNADIIESYKLKMREKESQIEQYMNEIKKEKETRKREIEELKDKLNQKECTKHNELNKLLRSETKYKELIKEEKDKLQCDIEVDNNVIEERVFQNKLNDFRNRVEANYKERTLKTNNKIKEKTIDKTFKEHITYTYQQYFIQAISRQLKEEISKLRAKYERKKQQLEELKLEYETYRSFEGCTNIDYKLQIDKLSKELVNTRIRSDEKIKDILKNFSAVLMLELDKLLKLSTGYKSTSPEITSLNYTIAKMCLSITPDGESKEYFEAFKSKLNSTLSTFKNSLEEQYKKQIAHKVEDECIDDVLCPIMNSDGKYVVDLEKVVSDLMLVKDTLYSVFSKSDKSNLKSLQGTNCTILKKLSKSKESGLKVAKRLDSVVKQYRVLLNTILRFAIETTWVIKNGLTNNRKHDTENEELLKLRLMNIELNDRVANLEQKLKHCT